MVFAQLRDRAPDSMIWRGSRPTVGSSSMMTSGRPISACAMPRAACTLWTVFDQRSFSPELRDGMILSTVLSSAGHAWRATNHRSSLGSGQVRGGCSQ